MRKVKQCKDCIHYYGRLHLSSTVWRLFIRCQNPLNNAQNDYHCEKSKVYYHRKWWKFWRPATIRKVVFMKDDLGKHVTFKDQSGMTFRPAGRGRTKRLKVIDLHRNDELRKEGKL